MVVEGFSHKLARSGLFDLFVAFVFFATVIFFLINSSQFSPFEIFFWTIVITIVTKATTNLMFSLIVWLYDLDSIKKNGEFERSIMKIEGLISELTVQEAEKSIDAIEAKGQ